MENCVFCKMVRGEIIPNIVWEDDSHIAFLDQSPIRSGHTLVIPKKHTDYLFDIEDKEYLDLMLASKKVSKLLKTKLNPVRVGVLVEGFGVAHAHVHLIPIDNGGQIDIKYAKQATGDELKKIADIIRG